MNRFKKWRKQRKPVVEVLPETSITEPPPHYETDPPEFIKTPSFRFGLTVVHDCPEPVVDICFIHGLTGDRDKTWTAVGGSTPWPQILLPPKLNARILMYGYDAHVTRKSVASSNRLINHAQNLLGDLTANRCLSDASSRPVIFVAHSLGGLVCKKAILLSQNAAEPESRALFDRLEGIVFMGTPHKGAWMADWAKIPASVFGLVKSTNVMLLEVLQSDNQLLDSIQVDFLTMIRRLRESGRNIGIACFFEELPFPVIGKIVTAESATLEGYDVYSIYANHCDMVRFASDEDPGFKRLLWKLSSWTSQVDQTQEIEQQHTMNAEDRACLRDLQTTNPRDDKLRIEATKGGLLKEAYTWVLSDVRFLEWQLKEKGGGLLWIRGDPGKGKTMLLCGIIDELSASDNGPLAFFFCQATDSRLDNAAAVLRGLIYMLVDQDPSLISHVRKRYDGTGERLFEGPNAWHALSKIFLDMLKDADSPCLIIDALDECKTGLFELLDFIVEASSSYPQVKWIISSRLLPEIKEYLGILPEKTRLTLEMNESSVSEAVETFIHHRVQKLEKLKRYDQEMSKAVSSHLLKNAHGTFLWVALVCERLAQLPRMRTIEKLTAFPPGLDPLYQRMMQQVQEHEESSLCKEILGILSTTYRPITLDELTTFVKVPECIVDDGHETLEEIIRYCGSFLTVTQSTVFFVHQSAKDFLLDQAKLQILPDGIQDKHRSIFEQSLEVLNKTLQRNILSLEDHTISIDQIRRMDYAPDSLKRTHYMCVSWIDHLRDCGSESTLHKFLQIGGLVDDFLSKRYLYWLEALSLLEMIPRGFQMTSKLEVLSRDSPISSQVLDASRFFQYHSSMIQKMPLQLYSSALLFTPTCSTVGRNFEHEKPGWVTLKPETRSWNPYFHLLGGHQGGIHHLSWAPDKKHVVTTSTNDQLIKLWDLTAGHCVMSLKGHSTYITSLAWSYDGNLLAATSYGGELKVWDPATGQCLLTISVPDVPLYSVFWSQDRTELVTVSWGLESEKSTQLSVNVWDGITGQCKMTLSPDEAQVKSVIPSFDGKSFIYFSSGGVKSWKLSHDQKIHSQHVSNGLSSEGILSHDGKSLVHSEGNVIKIFDPSTCEVTAILESGLQVDSTVRYLAFCHDDMKLASGFKNGIIEIWDLVTRQCISVLEGHSDKILTILWLKDGRVASGSDDATMRLWNPSTGQCLSTLKAQGSEPKDFILSSDETQFITTSSTDGSIKSWDMNASQPLDEHRRSVEILVLSRDGVHLASGSEDGTIKIWSRSNGQCITSFEEHTDYVLDLQWSPTGKIASVSLDQTIKIWDPLTGQCLHTIEKPCQWSSSMCWSADGSRLMFVTYENSVVEWDAITGQQLETRKTEHTGQNAKWSLDGTRFASTTEGSRIIVQDASTGLIVSDLSGFEDEFESLVDVPLCLRRAVQMCWSNDGAQLASVLGPTIKIWDTATGDCILVLELDQEPGSFHFSQGPSFSEPDSGYLHTSIGSFNIQSYMDLTSGSASSRLVCSPQPEGQGLDPSLQCVTRDGVNMMALPEDYIARHTDSMVIMGNTVVIGSTTGRVSILEFSESSSLSGMSSLKIRP